MNSESELYKELFKFPSGEFKSHLEIKNNERILFSGMYGVGKTTFLRYFFKNETQTEELGLERYHAIHLYPVNYSISTTEDIFKYIKIDILQELLLNYQDEIDFNAEKLSFETVASFYILNKFSSIAGPLLMLLDKLNHSDFPSEAVLNAFNTLKQLSDKACDSINKDVDRSDNIKQIGEFLNSEIAKEGSPYEQNLITNLIIDFTAQLQQKGKQTVLIIDDLDRLDPNHIFRLFNIFAAHFDQKYETQNKFGFNKVIFICDVSNIRRLYSHFYGAKASFNGYIDKFYSTKIFYFNNYHSVRELAESIVDEASIYIDFKELFGSKPENKMIRSNLSVVIRAFLLNNLINLRSLLKLKNPIYISNRYIGSKTHIVNWKYPVSIEFEILSHLFHHPDDILAALESTKERSNFLDSRSFNSDEYHSIAYNTVPLLSLVSSEIPTSRNRTYYINENLHYAVVESPRGNEVTVEIVDQLNNYRTHDAEGLPAVDLYINAFNFLTTCGYF